MPKFLIYCNSRKEGAQKGAYQDQREKQKSELREKMREKIHNKEMQKRKLEDAIRMHNGFMPNTHKSVQGNIINNFRNHRQNKSLSHMWHNTHDEAVIPMFTQPQDLREVNGIGNAIDLTEN